MEKLELKHLAPYLPYGLKILYNHNKVNTFVEVLNNENWLYIDDKKDIYYTDFKPIFRPLSDLFNGHYEYILDEFSEVSLESFKIAFLSKLKPLNTFDKINYTIVIKLFENHFDVFGLIEKGLAIDINKLAKTK